MKFIINNLTPFLFFLCMVLFVSCKKMDLSEHSYANFNEAAKAKAIGKGSWIPAFIPRSATNIKEIHDIDTNEIWLTCSIDTNYDKLESEGLIKMDGRQVEYPRRRWTKWWPAFLAISTAQEQEITAIYSFYKCPDGGFVAVSKTQLFYWHLGGKVAGK